MKYLKSFENENEFLNSSIITPHIYNIDLQGLYYHNIFYNHIKIAEQLEPLTISFLNVSWSAYKTNISPEMILLALRENRYIIYTFVNFNGQELDLPGILYEDQYGNYGCYARVKKQYETSNNKYILINTKERTTGSSSDYIRMTIYNDWPSYVPYEYDVNYPYYCVLYNPCFVEGTLITLADGSKKKVEDITYEDELLCWDFDNGKLTSSKPLWIKKEQVTDYYKEIYFSNGNVLKLVGDGRKAHRLFCKDKGEFIHATEMQGYYTVDENNNEVRVGEIKYIHNKWVKYYNIITDYHMNLYANGILTSCRYSNIYPIENMKYVKDDRLLKLIFDYNNIPEKYFKGMRLSEQPFDIEKTNNYIHNLMVLQHNGY